MGLWDKIDEYDKRRAQWRIDRRIHNGDDNRENIKKVFQAMALWIMPPADNSKFKQKLNKLDNKIGNNFTNQINEILRFLCARGQLPENLTINNPAADVLNPTECILKQLYRNFLTNIPEIPRKFREFITAEFNKCGTQLPPRSLMGVGENQPADDADLNALNNAFKNKIRDILIPDNINRKIENIADQNEISYKFSHRPDGVNTQIPDDDDQLLENAQHRINDMFNNRDNLQYQQKNADAWNHSNQRNAIYTNPNTRQNINAAAIQERARVIRVTLNGNNDDPEAETKLKNAFLKKLPEMRKQNSLIAPIKDFQAYTNSASGNFECLGEVNQQIQNPAAVTKVLYTLKHKPSATRENNTPIPDAEVEHIPQENKFTLTTQRNFEANEGTLYDTILMMSLSGINVLNMTDPHRQKMPNPDKMISVGKFGIDKMRLKDLIYAIAHECFNMRVSGIHAPEEEEEEEHLNNMRQYINGIKAERQEREDRVGALFVGQRRPAPVPPPRNPRIVENPVEEIEMGDENFNNEEINNNNII